jgi:hypothetical protein
MMSELGNLRLLTSYLILRAYYLLLPYFCLLHDEEILSTIDQLGAVEFLRTLFPYQLCLVLVLCPKLVVLVFQLFQSYHHVWGI